jgi:hypothetical protein
VSVRSRLIGIKFHDDLPLRLRLVSQAKPLRIAVVAPVRILIEHGIDYLPEKEGCLILFIYRSIMVANYFK